MPKTPPESSVRYHDDDRNDPEVIDHNRKTHDDHLWSCMACGCTDPQATQRKWSGDNDSYAEPTCNCSCHSDRVYR